MQKLNLIIPMLLLGAASYAQEQEDAPSKVGIVWGPDEKNTASVGRNSFMGHDENGIYIQRALMGKKFVIERYNAGMVRTGSAESEIAYGKKRKDYEFTLDLDGQLHFFTSVQDKKERLNKLFMQTVDKGSLTLNPDERVIATIDYGQFKKWNFGGFQADVSNDRSRVLVFYNLPFEGKSNERFGLQVFDSQFREIWFKEVELPFPDYLFTLVDATIDDAGNVFLHGSYAEQTEDPGKKARRTWTSRNYIFGFFNKGEDMREYALDAEGKWLTDLAIAVNENQDIVCAGLYSRENLSVSSGCFYIRLDGESRKIVQEHYKEFDMELITEGLSRKEEKHVTKAAEKGRSVGLTKYNLRSLVHRDDGGVVLVAEQYYVFDQPSYQRDANGKTVLVHNYFYHYGKIIVMNFKPDGNIDWIKSVPKSQVTNADGGYYSSFAMAVVKDKLYFVYNNWLNSSDRSNEDIFTSMFTTEYGRNKSAVVTLVDVDKDGNTTSEELFRARDAEVLIRPKISRQVSDHELVLFGEKGKYDRFIKLKLPE